MATSLDKSKLLEEEEEESFEHVDNLFEEEYEELKGRSNADYLPLEKGEILLRKGDVVAVTEQTLDGTAFLIVNCTTGEEGRVPVDYIDIDLDDDDGTESSLDNGVRRKKVPRAGIVRRPGVSKMRGSPLRRAYRLSSEDKAALIASLPTQEEGENPSGQSSLEGTPTSQPGPGGLGSLNVPSGGLARPKSWDPTVGRLQTSLPAGDTSSLDFRERHPPLTRDIRAQTMNLLPEVPPEYKLVEKYNIMSVSGADRDGRPVIVLSACRLPPSYLINHQRLLEYILLTLDKYVEQDYTLVYFHYGFTSRNKPSFSWLHQVYKELDRKYKKNVKKMYIVHPTNFIRIMMTLFKPIISYKFGRKVAYINRLDELKPVLFLDQIDVPEEVKKFDAGLTAPVRDVVKTDSKSVFHVPQYNPVEPSVLATKQFGVPLEVLKERSGGEEIPLVLKTCAAYLEQRGLDVLGIFRRTPSNALVHQIKGRFDAGEDMDFAEYGDPHLAAVVMKLFLRELPEPVMTFDSYRHITDLRGKTQDVRLQKCQEIVENLPQPNYDVLKYLIGFIQKVAEHQEVNKMTPLNLAIVFGPNLVWSQSEAASLTSLGEVNTFTLILITNFDKIFTK